MSTINELSSADQVSGGDLLPLWSASNGATRKISFTNFLAWLNDQAVVAQDGKLTQYSAPLTGATVALSDTEQSIWLILTPAGTIATLTLTFPPVANVADKTEILMNTTNTITALTLSGNGASIVGGITTLAANGFARYRYDLVLQTWYRVG